MKSKLTGLLGAITLLAAACGSPHQVQIAEMENILSEPVLKSRPTLIGIKCLPDEIPEREELFLSCNAMFRESPDYDFHVGIWQVGSDGLYHAVNGKARQYVPNMGIFSDRIGADYPIPNDVDIPAILERTWGKS